MNTVSGALGDTIWGNFIGVSQFNPKTFNPVSSKTANANGVGILIDSPNNVIGGTTPQYRNVIQGNSGDGVILYGSQGTRNTLDTNFILDNGGDGVLVLSATNQIGQAIGQGPSWRRERDLGQHRQRRSHPWPLGPRQRRVQQRDRHADRTGFLG